MTQKEVASLQTAEMRCLRRVEDKPEERGLGTKLLDTN